MKIRIREYKYRGKNPFPTKGVRIEWNPDQKGSDERGMTVYIYIGISMDTYVRVTTAFIYSSV